VEVRFKDGPQRWEWLWIQYNNLKAVSAPIKFLPAPHYFLFYFLKRTKLVLDNFVRNKSIECMVSVFQKNIFEIDLVRLEK